MKLKKLYYDQHIEELQNNIEGAVQAADHQVSEIGIRLMFIVGSMIVEKASILGESPIKILQHCKFNITRGDRWFRYSIQTAQKFDSLEGLPLMGVRKFICEHLTEIKKIELKCKYCPIKGHCKT